GPPPAPRPEVFLPLPAGQGVVAGPAIEGVVPGSTDEDVVAGPALQGVAGVVAGDGVVEAVAGAVQRPVGQDQVLDFVRQGEIDRGDHRVDPGAGRFGDHVVGVVDVEGVATAAA